MNIHWSNNFVRELPPVSPIFSSGVIGVAASAQRKAFNETTKSEMNYIEAFFDGVGAVLAALDATKPVLKAKAKTKAKKVSRNRR